MFNDDKSTEKKEFDIFDINEIIKILWNDKLIIFFITFVFSIGSVIYALKLPNLYKASALVEVVDAKSSSNSIMASQFGGVASSLGFALPNMSGDKGSLVVETLQSKIFIKSILENPKIKENIYAIKSYDVNTDKILYDEKSFDSKSGKWIRKAPINRSVEPSYIEVHESLQGTYSVTKDIKTGFITISYTHLSPVFANNFINLVIKTANDIARKSEIEDAQKAIDFLNLQNNNTNVLGVQESINSLIEAQLKILMLANIKENYLIRPIDPSFVPEIKTYPNRKIICIIGAMLGGILSLMMVILRSFLVNK